MEEVLFLFFFLRFPIHCVPFLLEQTNSPMRNMAKNFGNRRETTRRDDIKTSENITRIGKKKNHSDVANLLRILKTHFVFENYSHEEL